jgi:hypothetical protein
MGPVAIAEVKSQLAAAPFEAAWTIANKQFAHAPAPSSIPVGGIPSMTFDELWQCQRTIIEVTSFVGTFILHGGTHGVVAIPQLGMFERWDRPFIPPGSDEKLRELWDASSEEREAWSRDNPTATFDAKFP